MKNDDILFKAFDLLRAVLIVAVIAFILYVWVSSRPIIDNHDQGTDVCLRDINASDNTCAWATQTVEARPTPTAPWWQFWNP